MKDGDDLAIGTVAAMCGLAIGVLIATVFVVEPAQAMAACAAAAATATAVAIQVSLWLDGRELSPPYRVNPVSALTTAGSGWAVGLLTLYLFT